MILSTYATYNLEGWDRKHGGLQDFPFRLDLYCTKMQPNLLKEGRLPWRWETQSIPRLLHHSAV